MNKLIAVLLAVAFFRCDGGDATQNTSLNTAEPGLKIIYETTNLFVVYLDEPWTVGPGFAGGYDERHIKVLCDRNYGLKEKIRTRTWDGMPQQLYQFDDQRVFTCETADVGSHSHETKIFSLIDDSISISDDAYAVARQRYGLSSNQFFLGRIETNIFYWEAGNFKKVFYRPLVGQEVPSYFELPREIIDLFGATKGIKKDVGFTILQKATGFFRPSPNVFNFLEFSFKDAKSGQPAAPVLKIKEQAAPRDRD